MVDVFTEIIIDKPIDIVTRLAVIGPGQCGHLTGDTIS